MLDDFLLGNYKVVANKLGLAIEGRITDGNVSIHGSVEGVTLKMWFGPYAVHITAQFAAPIGAPFLLVTTGWLARIGHHLSSPAAVFGDADLDHHFTLKAGEASAVAALLSADARRALLDVARDGLHPALTETGLHVSRYSKGGMDAADKIERDFHDTARLARALGHPLRR